MTREPRFRPARLVRALAAAGMLMAAAPASADQSVTIGSGDPSGIYHPVADAVADLWNARTDDLTARVEVTGGSMENLARVASGELDLGIARSDLLNDALLGFGAFADGEPLADLRVLFTLHPEPVTVIARADAGIAAFDDVAGKRVNFGPPGTAGRAMLELLAEAWEWTEDDFAAVAEIPPETQMDALCAGEVDAVAFVAAHPTGTVADALDACATVLVPVAGGPAEKLLQVHTFLAPATIPAGLYDGQDAAVPTVGPVAAMVAGAAMPDADAAMLTRALFEGLDDLRSAHPVLMLLDAASMAGQDLALPMHPGALRYYLEAGLFEAPAEPSAE